MHAPLALKHFPTIKKYVRNYIKFHPEDPEPDFDCITEFWFEDEEGYRAVLDFLETKAGKVILDEEKKFMDRSRLVQFLVDEKVSV